MKKSKLFIILVVLAACLLLLSGCEGMQHVVGNRVTSGSDVQSFHQAIIVLDGHEIAKGAITQWRDYDDSDVVQVMIDGKYYLTHYSNVVMVADPNQGGITYDIFGDYN